MSDPISWQIVGCVQTALQSIAVSSGYFTDAGATILVDPTAADAIEDLLNVGPFLVVTSTGFSSQATPGQSQFQRELAISIEGAVSTKQDGSQRLGHCLLDDIEQALIAINRNGFDGLAGVTRVNMALSDRTIETRPDGLDAIVVKVQGTAKFLQQVRPPA